MVGHKVIAKKNKPTIHRPTNAFGQFVKLSTLNKGPINKNTLKNLAVDWHKGPPEKKMCMKIADKQFQIYNAKKLQYERSRPKRALNGYQMFMKHYLRKNVECGKQAKTTLSEGAGKWRSMTEAEKCEWSKMKVGRNNNNRKASTSGKKRTAVNKRRGGQSVKRGRSKLAKNRTSRSRSAKKGGARRKK